MAIPVDDKLEFRQELRKFCDELIVTPLVNKGEAYGDSWKRRGGVGAFMMAARKWDRLEKYLSQYPKRWDIFEAIFCDDRPEGVRDDVLDLIGYLVLIAHHTIYEGDEFHE